MEIIALMFDKNKTRFVIDIWQMYPITPDNTNQFLKTYAFKNMYTN